MIDAKPVPHRLVASTSGGIKYIYLIFSPECTLHRFSIFLLRVEKNTLSDYRRFLVPGLITCSLPEPLPLISVK